MCDMSQVSHKKAEKRGGLLYHQNQSCSKLPEMDGSSVKIIFPHGGGGAFLPQKLKLLKIV